MKKATGSSSTGASESMDRAYSDLQPLRDLHADPMVDTNITSDLKADGSALRQGAGVPPDAIAGNTITIRSGK